MEPFGSLLGAAGSIASLISLYLCLKLNKTWMLKILLFCVFILVLSSSFYSYQYYESTKPEILRKQKQMELRAAIKEFVGSDLLHASYFNPGESEGIINSGLIILEQYKELYPDQYQRIKKQIESELKYAKDNRESTSYRELMEQIGINIGVTLKKLAGIR